MKRIALFSGFSLLSLALLLGISSANRPVVDTSPSFTPVETQAAPNCRRVHGAACRPAGTTIRCSIGDPPEIRLCVCENGAFNCR
jgi:hypothetical protein